MPAVGEAPVRRVTLRQPLGGWGGVFWALEDGELELVDGEPTCCGLRPGPRGRRVAARGRYGRRCDPCGRWRGGKARWLDQRRFRCALVAHIISAQEFERRRLAVRGERRLGFAAQVNHLQNWCA